MKHRKPLAMLALTALACSTVPLLHLQLNRTESGPVGLWRAHPDRTPVVGDVARFCMRPEQARQTAGRSYAGGSVRGPCAYRTWMLAKPVVAAAGDTVEHTPMAVVINGRALPLSPTRASDSHGRAIPIAPFGRRVLRPGEYWVHSPYSDASFDSRYVGIVRANEMRGTLTPVLTWLTSRQRAALRARGLTPSRCGTVACVQPDAKKTLCERYTGTASVTTVYAACNLLLLDDLNVAVAAKIVLPPDRGKRYNSGEPSRLRKSHSAKLSQ